uniref:C3H1-type domain-containing protein n=1 Tax=Colobus angolensis palliatus TaxID=336983 RepID=A0A2K5HIL2_COLAP
MDFENLFSKPPNPALGKTATDSDERINDEIDDAEVEETQEEKIKLEHEQIPKKVRLITPVNSLKAKENSSFLISLSTAKQKKKNLKAGNKNGKQKKMKRKWPGTGNKGSNALLRNSGSQEEDGKPKEKQQHLSQAFINQHTVERKGKQICKYFLERKCIKGDQCKFDHDAEIEKKKEMCKFYVQGYCTRVGLKLFFSLTLGLHEYPCKFYHTGTKCYQGEYCKFSHAPLTPETQELLAKVLDTEKKPCK